MAQILYQKVADDIKRNILSGFYEVGNLMPTEHDLEEKYGVSKITVRKAVDQLVAEGYIAKKSGIGTRVISNDLFNKLSKAKSYSSIVNDKGKLTKEVLEIKYMGLKDTPINQTLVEPILYIKRLYLLDGKPFLNVNHYIPNVMVNIQKSELQNKSLYKFLKDNGKNINSFKDEFTAVNLDETEKQLLNKKDTLALKRIRRGFDKKGELIEYTESIYDSSKMPYEIEYEI